MVNGVNSTTSSTGTSTTSSSSTSTASNTLGKSDFFKLLISQLKYQDPLNPTDGTEFAAQLAQYSSLEQLQNMNDNLTTSINANYTLSQSINNTMAASFIGKDVKLSGGSFSYNGQSSIKLGYNITNIAKDVTLKIYDSNGSLVKTVKATDVDKGDHTISWDFKNDQGTSLPTGTYKFEVSATANNGDSLSTSIYKLGTITGVRYSDSGTKLLVDNNEYELSDVSEILGADTTGGSN